MAWCTICDKSFYNASNLRGHARKFHSDELDEIAPKKKNHIAVHCLECGKSFCKNSNLNRHVKIFHSDKFHDLVKPRINSKGNSFQCDKCGKHIMNPKKIRYHMKRHQTHDIVRTCDETIRKREKFKCCLCYNHDEISKKSEIWQHFEEVHDIKLSYVNLKFSNEDEFNSWKIEIEQETKSHFVNEHGSYSTKSYIRKNFICHRSGTYKPVGHNVRRLKVQGSNKINGFCPAEIILKVLNNGECEVKFVSDHIGHNQDFEHMTLSKTEREAIAAKIAAKIPFQTILDEVREESLSEDKLKRMHLLTKKDLYNIEQCYKLNNEAVRHVKDASSVDAWVKEVEDSCVLLYKPQHTSFEIYPHLRNEDFLLIIMNQGQAELLEKYSNDCICIDRTHDLNGYEFELVTLLVLDELRESFPSAFFISNRTDEAVMKIFFSVIKDKLGRNLQPNIFMSDMEQSFYNAWIQIMGPVDYRLFSTWHVDRAWRTNLNKINTKEKQITVYKMLRKLLQEKDANDFTQMCANVMKFFYSNSDTNEFGAYFEEYFLKDVQSWAYCYQINCGIKTNMHLEQMHRTIKHIYLNGKKIKRLDKVMNILMKFIRDKLFDRLIAMSEGQIFTKIKVLKNRHQASKTLDVKRVVVTDTGFGVLSSKKEMYLVQERQPNCNCSLVCTECQICLHHYSCTCIDSSIKWNMCKHIHLICRSLKEQSVGIIEEQVIDTPLPAKTKNRYICVDKRKLTTYSLDAENLFNENYDSDSGDQELSETITIIGEQKTDTNELNSEKEKFKLKVNKLIDSIESPEELNTFEKLFETVQPTLLAIKREKHKME